MPFLVEYSEVSIGSNTDYVRQWCRFRYQPEFLRKNTLINAVRKL